MDNIKNKVRNPAAVIVLSVVTCGIYALIWIYRFARDLKEHLEREDISPGLDVFLSIICFPYIIYWAYKYGELVNEARDQVGLKVSNDDSVLYLILAIFGLFIVDMAIMQGKMNEVWQAA